MEDLIKKARQCASEIKKYDDILIVSHIDADGLTSAAIAHISLERAGISSKVCFVKQLDDTYLNNIEEESYDLVLFTDLGSGMQDEILARDLNAVIVDHHVPRGDNIRFHLNPHLVGFDGSDQLSGSSTTYLLSTQLGMNYDLVNLAVVGAVGDLQDSKKGRLVGLNRKIMLEGVRNGFIDNQIDLRMFGKQTRPVYRMLQYSSDPIIPGITGREEGCTEFLRNLGIPLKEGEKWRRWIDLDFSEKRKIVSELVKLAIESGINASLINRLVGEVYILLSEPEGTELRDAMEFSTLLNATARYGYEEIGLKICMGDRDRSFSTARRLLAEHRKNLADGLNLVKENGIEEMENLQYFHAGKKIRETIVGIVAGMSIPLANTDKPIIAFAKKDEGIKVSARATQNLVRKGINLAEAINRAAKEVGGVGGGHNIAAGATIPEGKEEEFLQRLNGLLEKQLKSKGARL